jgi:lipid-A-disaccharide synthase-like uncharacterized protein
MLMGKTRRAPCVALALACFALAGRGLAAEESGRAQARERLRAALAAAIEAYDRDDLATARDQVNAATGAIKGQTLSRFWAAVASLDFAEAGRVMNWVLVAWIAVGLLGQALFTARFVVQWLASERRGESVVPTSFWYFSIGGSLLVLSYALWRLDPVFILAYGFNSIVYVRNLMLIHRKRREAVQ